MFLKIFSIKPSYYEFSILIQQLYAIILNGYKHMQQLNYIFLDRLLIFYNFYEPFISFYLHIEMKMKLIYSYYMCRDIVL